MSLGVFGLRSYEKHVPEKVFAQPAAGIARFLRHLWATDGCIHFSVGVKSLYANVYYATSSQRLARDVQSLVAPSWYQRVASPPRTARQRYAINTMSR